MTTTADAPTQETAPDGERAVRADFWFDPMCPWAWMTSRWMTEVAEHRPVDLHWHVMSLSVLNEGRDLPDGYRQLMDQAWRPVRVITAARLAHGEDVVKPLYDAIGTRLHPGGRKDDLRAVLAESLAEVGLPAELLDAADDDAHDEELRASHQRAIDLVGDEVGTPVVAVEGVAYFGPVVTPAPRGEDALRLWDGLVLMTQVPGFYELKRTRTQGPVLD
ncbi:DSBA oxidoreductase [Actinotalea ferrariae CF5-4]|uniref:DSBA oxidoreductase n=1 Tax=Actinotalea ferrariae CF5-4 TaxID=948458 RepID=A0A021VTJ4_9CELL|nr:DsbA family protein [Actinotalea ferrariae]EYR64529.1 DSBA oxidoreductase [Actinotalea ferrariae CF5-4]